MTCILLAFRLHAFLCTRGGFVVPPTFHFGSGCDTKCINWDKIELKCINLASLSVVYIISFSRI